MRVGRGEGFDGDAAALGGAIIVAKFQGDGHQQALAVGDLDDDAFVCGRDAGHGVCFLA